jgi:N-acetylmuramic acid 6-phosphate etherase
MEASGCDGETADKLLEQSRGEVKPAILMHLAGIDYETAVQKLKDNQGRLKQALK